MTTLQAECDLSDDVPTSYDFFHRRQALESFTVNVILQRTGTKLHANYIPSFLDDVDKKSPMIFDNVAWVLYCSKLRHNPEFICCVPLFAIGTREF